MWKVNSSTEMARVLSDLRKWMINANTDPVLMTSLMHCIQQWLQFGYHQPNLENLHIQHEANHTLIMSAINTQSIIGWNHFFKGRLASAWGEIQARHYTHAREQPNNTIKKYHDRDWWTSNLIKQIVYIALNAWQIRNDKLHEDKKQDEYNTERRLLHDQIKLWYDREGEFGDNDHARHFNRTYNDRKNSTNAELRQWTRAIQSTYTYMKKQTEYKNQARITDYFAQ